MKRRKHVLHHRRYRIPISVFVFTHDTGEPAFQSKIFMNRHAAFPFLCILNKMRTLSVAFYHCQKSLRRVCVSVIKAHPVQIFFSYLFDRNHRKNICQRPGCKGYHKRLFFLWKISFFFCLYIISPGIESVASLRSCKF